MKIILFSGKAEAGKTTSAKLLKKKLTGQGKHAVIIPYGDYVKHTAKLLFGWDGNKDEVGRQLLQWWGTDFVRKKDSMFWVETVMRIARVLDGTIDYILIDDVRFVDEIVCWFGYDYLSVRVERPGHENSLTAEQLHHISETELDNWKFDVTITATNISELEEQVSKKVFEVVK